MARITTRTRSGPGARSSPSSRPISASRNDRRRIAVERPTSAPDVETTHGVHLTRAQLRELEQELRNERARLERSLSARTETGDATPPLGSVRQVPADAEGTLAAALEARTLGRHQTIVAALERLEAGTYGACVICQRPIPYGRLLAVPEATHCVACGSGV